MLPAYYTPVFTLPYIAQYDVTYCYKDNNTTFVPIGICRFLVIFLIFSVKKTSFYTNKTEFFSRKSKLPERKNLFLKRKRKLFAGYRTKLTNNWVFYAFFPENLNRNGLSFPLICKNRIKKTSSLQGIGYYFSIKMFLLRFILQNRLLSAFSSVLISEIFCRQLKNPDSFFICYNVCLKTKIKFLFYE
jgi:hypothetical protein